MKLSKGLIGIIAAIVIIGVWAASAYNSMVSVQETTTTALANVQSTYQRRADLTDARGRGCRSFEGHSGHPRPYEHDS